MISRLRESFLTGPLSRCSTTRSDPGNLECTQFSDEFDLLKCTLPVQSFIYSPVSLSALSMVPVFQSAQYTESLNTVRA